jgi:TatD DNase family protein
MFVDSHCHLNLLDFAKLKLSLSEVIQDAIDNKLSNILSVSTEINQHDTLINIAANFPMVNISAGVHPEHALETNPNELLTKLLSIAEHHSVVAIGETGLDYYYLNKESDLFQVDYIKKLQQELFTVQIQVANQLNKPLIVHTRMARKDTIEILTNQKAYLASGVMHCFTEDWVMAKQALDLGFYISFSGIITFHSKVDELLDVVKKVPLERILIETDSPFLAPTPFRGKINRPSYVVYVAKKIAELKNVSLAKVAEITTNNYKKLFKVFCT